MLAAEMDMKHAKNEKQMGMLQHCSATDFKLFNCFSAARANRLVR